MALAMEVLLKNAAIANLIRNSKTEQINNTIQTSREAGMVILEDHLAQLVKKGTISEEDAMNEANDPGYLQLSLKKMTGEA